MELQLWTDLSGIATGKRGKHTAGYIRTPQAKFTRLTSSRTDSSPLLSPSVEFALRAVAQKYVLDGYPDPQRASPAQQSLDLPIACLLKKYGDEDPPPETKLAVPISTITGIAEKYRWTAHLSAVADLVIIAFFYLL